MTTSLLNELRVAATSGSDVLARSPRQFRLLLQYIDENLETPFDAATLARRLHLSTSQARRLFKRWLQTSPMNWIRDRRIERGRQLLSSTRLSVAEIADMLGFSEQFYFSRVFKKQTGLSPLAYRRRDSLVL